MTLVVRKMTKRVDGERPNRLMDWFGRAVMAADFDLRLHDKEKGESWRDAPALSLFNKMMGHVSLMMDPESRVGHIHAIKVVNYALMIATRLAGDRMPVEAKPEKIVLREIIYPHTGHIESNVEFGPPIIAGEDESDPIVETGLPPLDLGPLPNGPAISKVKEEPLEAEPEDAKKVNLLSMRSGIIHRGKKICDDGVGEQYKLDCGRKVYVGVFKTRYGITELGVTCQRCLKKIGEKK